MAVDLVVGKSLEALCSVLEEVISKNRIFSGLCKDIKDSLDSLEPVINQIAKYNQQSNRARELEALEDLIKRGIELVGKCSKLRKWQVYNKWKYANKFLEFKQALQDKIEVLKVQEARDVKKIEDGVDKMQVAVEDIQQGVSMLVKKQHEAVTGAVLPDLPDLIVGLDVPLKELKEKLLKDEVTMLIVTAPGGCGKTTLATKFCEDKDIKDTFKNNIFFVTFSKNPNLENIMQELYQQKGYTVPSNRNALTPPKWLKQVEMEKGGDPILLILDDVWSGSESLLEKFEFKISNCKILVTSRSEFPRFGSSYQLKLLDNDNAMELFRHIASMEDKSSHIPKDLAKEIVKHCNGFPLAIKVAGGSLRGQPEEMWRCRIDEWSKGSSILDFETELLLQLQSSIDVLDNAMPKLKECFLDLGAFPEDAKVPLTALIDMWAELHDLESEMSCLAKLYELSNRGLVLFKKRTGIQWEAKDYRTNYVRQHDLLRELSIYNSRRDPMEQRERLIIEISGNNFPKWWREQNYPYINARLVSISTDEELSVNFPNMQLPKAEVLILNFQSRRYAIPEFVESMHKLKILLVMNDTGIDGGLDNFPLLGSLSNLKSLRLDGVSFSYITKNKVQLKNLYRLHVREQGEYEREDSSVEVSHVFPNLKEMVFNLHYSRREWPAGFWKLIHLTKLHIVGSFRELALPEAIGNLVRLEALVLEDISAEVPDTIGNLRKLKYLRISRNEKLEKLPEQMGELKCLRHLIINSCYNLCSLPGSTGDLVSLEGLSLVGCSTLRELPESITNLQKLNFLDISRCYHIEKLPHHIGELKSLKKLHMSHVDAVTELPKSVSDLEQLEQVICPEWDATHLWMPLSSSLRNLSVLARKSSEERQTLRRIRAHESAIRAAFLFKTA